MRNRWAILALIIAGLGLRVSQSVFAAGIYDQTSYEIVAGIMQHGGNVYALTSRYNYSPVWAYVLFGLNQLATLTGISFVVMIRLFLSLVDVVNALLIGMIAERERVGAGLTSLAAYLLNPLAILIVGFDGQFECLATLFLLAAVLIYQRYPHKGLIWGLATVGLVVKHIVIFSVWTILIYTLKPRRAALYMAASLAIFALSFAPFLPDGAQGIFANVLRYKSLTGVYGLSTFLPAGLASAVFLVVMAALPLIAYYRLRLTLPQAMILSAVGFMTLIYGIGDQYFILVALWAAITPTKRYWLYSIVAALTIPVGWNVVAQSIKGSGIGIILMLNAVWLICVVWFLSYFRRNRGKSRIPVRT